MCSTIPTPDIGHQGIGRSLVKISIIIPVFNEAAILPGFLAHVREHAPAVDLIVCDGGSSDGTCELAARLEGEYRCQLIQGPRGRASQMNSGARAASGEIFWFLHVDSQLPAGCVESIHEALADPARVGGCFRLRMPEVRTIYRVSDWLGNIAVDLFRIALGDHGIFCRREVFEKLGGYPEIPLMEDARFYQALQRYGSVRQLRPMITTSPRFYEKHGPVRTTLYYLFILALYVIGTPISLQHRVYRHLARSAPPLRRLTDSPGPKCSGDIL